MTLFWDWSDVFAVLIAVGLAFLAGIIISLVAAVVLIWAINQLFDLGMQYSLFNILAMAALHFFLRGGVTIKTKK